MEKFKLNITDFKILSTVQQLNDLGYYPLNEGIFKIVTGIVDDETKKFENLSTFSTLVSYSSKKICSLTLMLTRYKYLEKIFDRKTNELYFKITVLGQNSLQNYLKNRKLAFQKKEKISKITIAKIS